MVRCSDTMTTAWHHVQVLLRTVDTENAGKALAIVRALPPHDPRFDVLFAGGNAAVGFWLQQPEGEADGAHAHPFA